MPALLDHLRSGRVLLMDGAMGSELLRAGLTPGENGASWNRSHPEHVRAIHAAYRAAGADVLLSNTFLINDSRIPVAVRSDLLDAAFDVMETGTPPYRLVSLGPIAGAFGKREFERLDDLLPLASLESRADGVLLETCSTPRVRLACRRLCRETALPLFLSLTYLHGAGGLATISGHAPEWFAERAGDYGAAALGVNCGRDVTLADCAAILRRYRKVTDLPLFARPNAGTPTLREGVWHYPLGPEQMAEQMPILLEEGARMIGGCCGTTPAHIAALRPIVAAWNARGTPRC